jgi:hypothetical protein
MFAARSLKSMTLIMIAVLGLLSLTACVPDAQFSQDLTSSDPNASHRLDLLFAVDASTLRDSNRVQVENSIQKVVAELEAQGKDVRYAVYSAGAAPLPSSTSSTNPAQAPGLDIFSNLLGIFGGNQFLSGGWSAGLPSGSQLPSQVAQGYPQLFPIISQIAAMSSGGSSSNAIFASALPIFSQVLSQQLGGSTNSGINQQLLMQLIQSATAGKQQGMNQNEILMTLAPQVLAMLQGNGALGGSQGNMASLLLPTLLRLYGQGQGGGGIDESQITNLILPILMGQINGGNFGGSQPLQLLGFIFPLLQQFTGMDQQGIQNLAVALAPLAVNYFSGGAGGQYAPMVQAMIPVLFQMMGNGQSGAQLQDSMQLLGTPGITSILSAFTNGGPLADGFLRNGSDFSIVFLGDQMNVGDSTQAAALAHTFLTNLKSLTGRDLSDFSFNSISMNANNSCSTTNVSSVALASVLSQRTGGGIGNLCNLQAILQALSK